MRRLISKLMLTICVWNILGSSLPVFAARDFETRISTQMAQSEEASLSSPSEVANSHEDCDPANCENEHCRFHQCHLGHCNFVVKGSASYDPTWSGEDLISSTFLKIQSVYLADPSRPPSA